VIEYVEETGFTNAAAPVAEGATKPPSNLTFELVQLSAKVIAHVITASRQILSDAPMLQSYVDGRMVYGVKLEEEDQMLYGDGLAENLTGLLTHAARQTYTESTDGQVGDTKLHSIRRAITRVTLAEYVASGVALHPTDKEEVDLLQGTDDHFLHLDVSGGNVPAYFRIPIVETTAIVVGEAAVGAFNLAARIHDVWNATVQLFEQHADYAATNKVLVRAEERMALANERPEAIVHVTFDGAPTA
jgi:HK97 family phage major capsid protein